MQNMESNQIFQWQPNGRKSSRFPMLDEVRSNAECGCASKGHTPGMANERMKMSCEREQEYQDIKKSKWRVQWTSKEAVRYQAGCDANAINAKQLTSEFFQTFFGFGFCNNLMLINKSHWKGSRKDN